MFAHPYRAGAEKARRARISRVSSIVLVSRENNVIDPSMGVQRIDPNTNQTLLHERETRRGGRNRNANISLPSANIYIHESIPENFSNIHLFLSPFLPFHFYSRPAVLTTSHPTRLDETIIRITRKSRSCPTTTTTRLITRRASLESRKTIQRYDISHISENGRRMGWRRRMRGEYPSVVGEKQVRTLTSDVVLIVFVDVVVVVAGYAHVIICR